MDDRFVQPDRDTIRRLRQSCVWSQEQLAEAARLPKRTVESGRRRAPASSGRPSRPSRRRCVCPQRP